MSECENIPCTRIHSNRYKFHSFLALNSTNIISKVPNLISTFVLMSVFIILSGVNSGHSIGDFYVCERMSTYFYFVQNILQPHRQSTKLTNMIPSIKTKILIKFGTSRMMCAESRAKKL